MRVQMGWGGTSGMEQYSEKKYTIHVRSSYNPITRYCNNAFHTIQSRFCEFYLLVPCDRYDRYKVPLEQEGPKTIACMIPVLSLEVANYARLPKYGSIRVSVYLQRL